MTVVKQKQFGIFAKYWEPGSVKTRLAKSVGADLAAEFHHASLHALLHEFGSCGGHRVLGFTPVQHRAEFEALSGIGWELQPQSAGDLGDRMRNYFDQAFARGHDRVVLIGSDSPQLRVAAVEAAWNALAAVDVVLGPTYDGGYYLIGGRPGMPDVFTDVAWSTEEVLSETCVLLEEKGATSQLLEVRLDVDTIDDVDRLAAELDQQPRRELDGLRQVCARCLQATH